MEVLPIQLMASRTLGLDLLGLHGILVHLVGELEDSGSSHSPDKLQDGVDQSLEEEAPVEDVGSRDAERHGRVQGASRDAADGEATHCHAGADDQAEEVGSLLGC